MIKKGEQIPALFRAPLGILQAAEISAAILLAVMCEGCDRHPAPTTQPAGQTKMSPNQTADVAWRDCVSRVQTADGTAGQFEDARAEHDAWIETNQRLEEALRKYPNHTGMMRDLVIADMSLLSFEIGSHLQFRVCRMTAEAATRLETAGGDFRLISQARQLVFQALKIYPCVKDGAKAMTAIAPAHFLEIQTLTLGSLSCTTDRTLDPAPDPRLLWDEVFFILTPTKTMLPENTSAYVLSRQGEGAEAKYYLFFRSIHGEQLVTLFGREHPDLPTIEALIDGSVTEAIREAK